MALKKELVKEILSNAGVDAEHITSATNQIIDGHLASINALRDEITELKEAVEKYKPDAEKLPGVQKELKELKSQVEADAKERKGKDYDALKKEFDDYKADQERRAAKENVYKNILKDAGIPEKHYAKILKYSDVDSLELDEKGQAKNAKDILKAIKEEWDDHTEKQTVKGTNTENPPAGKGSGGKMTLEQIDAIKDTSERQKAMMANPELFGL